MPSRRLLGSVLFGLSGLLFGLASTSAAGLNSCSNISAHGSFDQNGIRQSDNGLYAVGTFRIEDEKDESKQPMFNLTEVACEKISDSKIVSYQCRVKSAIVWAQSEKPSADGQNCSLDFEEDEFVLKESARGIFSGIDDSTGCFNSNLVIDLNSKRTFRSFTKSRYAGNYEKAMPGSCKVPPRQVLMNCTEWAKLRKGIESADRYCDFSSSSDATKK